MRDPSSHLHERRALVERMHALVSGDGSPVDGPPDASAQRPTTGRHAGSEHLTIAEAFLRGFGEDLSSKDHAFVIATVEDTGALGGLTVIGPEQVRSHSSPLHSGTLVNEIPVCTVPPTMQELLVAVFGVERSLAVANVIETMESLSTATDHAADAGIRAALMAATMDRIELLARSTGASMLAQGSVSWPADSDAASTERYAVISSEPAMSHADEQYFVMERRLSRGRTRQAARPARAEDVVLLRIGPAPARTDPSRLQQLRRQHALLEGGQILDEATAELETYQQKAERLRLANRLAALFGAAEVRRLPAVTPIGLEVAGNLTDLLMQDDHLSPGFTAKLGTMRDALRYEVGVEFPGTGVRVSETDIPDGTYAIGLDEIPVVSGQVVLDEVLVNQTTDRLSLLGITGEQTSNPANGNEAAWVAARHEPALTEAGFTVWHPDDYIVLHLSSVLRRNASSFLTLEAVSTLVRQKAPETLDAIRSQPGGLPRFASVLRALVAEEVPIHEIKLFGEHYLDVIDRPTHEIPEELRTLEPVRTELRWNTPRTPIFKLGENFTRLMENSITGRGEATVLAIEPEPTQDALSAVRAAVDELQPTSANPVLFVDDWRLRPFLRKLVELEFPNLFVVSRREVSDADTMPVVATIEIER